MILGVNFDGRPFGTGSCGAIYYQDLVIGEIVEGSWFYDDPIENPAWLESLTPSEIKLLYLAKELVK